MYRHGRTSIEESTQEAYTSGHAGIPRKLTERKKRATLRKYQNLGKTLDRLQLKACVK